MPVRGETENHLKWIDRHFEERQNLRSLPLSCALTSRSRHLYFHQQIRHKLHLWCQVAKALATIRSLGILQFTLGILQFTLGILQFTRHTPIYTRHTPIHTRHTPIHSAYSNSTTKYLTVNQKMCMHVQRPTKRCVYRYNVPPKDVYTCTTSHQKRCCS